MSKKYFGTFYKSLVFWIFCIIIFMQQNINQEQFTSLWGDHTINVQLIQNTLTIKLIDNKTGRKYGCGYTMDNLPDRIKNNYGTL